MIKFFLEAGKNLECQVMMERTLNSRDNHAHTNKIGWKGLCGFENLCGVHSELVVFKRLRRLD